MVPGHAYTKCSEHMHNVESESQHQVVCMCSQEVSIGLNSTGSHVCDSVFTPFNPPWPKLQPGRTLTVLVDLSNPSEGRIGYAIEGMMLGFLPQTFSINPPETPSATPGQGDGNATGTDKDSKQQEHERKLQAVALFPHLLLRNCVVSINTKADLMPRLQPSPDDPRGLYRPWAVSHILHEALCM